MPAPVGILYGGGLAPVACLPPVGGRCDLEPEEETEREGEREGGREERYSTYMGVCTYSCRQAAEVVMWLLWQRPLGTQC